MAEALFFFHLTGGSPHFHYQRTELWPKASGWSTEHKSSGILFLFHLINDYLWKGNTLIEYHRQIGSEQTQLNSSAEAHDCASYLHIIEFDVESGPADRELGLEDLSHGRAQLPVDAGADPADGDELTVRRRFFARRERHGHRAVYRHHDVLQRR